MNLMRLLKIIRFYFEIQQNLMNIWCKYNNFQSEPWRYSDNITQVAQEAIKFNVATPSQFRIHSFAKLYCPFL